MIVGVWHRVKSQNQPAGSLELKVPGQNSSEQFDHIMSQMRPQLPVLNFHRFCIKMMEQTWKEVCTYSDALQQQQQQKNTISVNLIAHFLVFWTFLQDHKRELISPKIKILWTVTVLLKWTSEFVRFVLEKKKSKK